MLFDLIGGEDEVPRALWASLRPVVLVENLTAARNASRAVSRSEPSVSPVEK